MSRPSDAFEQDELREEYDWMYEFQSRMAERITGDKDVHNLVDYVDKLEAENAKLREELDCCLRLAPNCDGCEAMLDCDECLRADSSQKERKRLDYENGQLRELVRDMWNGMCGYAHDCRSCEHYELYEGQRLVCECQYHARMRELGVEV